MALLRGEPSQAHYIRQFPRKLFHYAKDPISEGGCDQQKQTGRGRAAHPLSHGLRRASSPKGTPWAMPQTFSSPPKAVPLGKVAANAVSRRKGYSTAAPHFRRKQALQMQFPATTPPVKKASVALRRVRQTRKFKIIFPLNMARAQRRPFKIVPRPAGERAQKAPPSGELASSKARCLRGFVPKPHP